MTLKPNPGGMWQRAFVNGVDHLWTFTPDGIRLIHDAGTGLLLYGCRDWTDLNVAADVTPHLAKRVGVCARVQGMRRYYALVVQPGRAAIVRECEGTTTLAEMPFDMRFYETYDLALTVEGNRLIGSIGGEQVLEASDDVLTDGGVALLVEEGRTATKTVTLSAP